MTVGEVIGTIMVIGVVGGIGYLMIKDSSEDDAKIAAAEVAVKQQVQSISPAEVRRKVLIERVEPRSLCVYDRKDPYFTHDHEIEYLTVKDGEKRLKLIYPNTVSLDTGVATLTWHEVPQGFVTLEAFVRQYVSEQYSPCSANDEEYEKRFHILPCDGIIKPFENGMNSIVYEGAP